MSALYTLRGYLFKHRWPLLAGIFFVLAGNGVNLLGPYVLKLAIDSLRSGVDMLTLAKYGLFIVLISIVQGIFGFGARWQVASVSRYIEREMRDNLFSHFQKLELAFFQRNKTGDLVARATNDLAAVRGLAGPGISNLLNTLAAFVLTVIVMVRIDVTPDPVLRGRAAPALYRVYPAGPAYRGQLQESARSVRRYLRPRSGELLGHPRAQGLCAGAGGDRLVRQGQPRVC